MRSPFSLLLPSALAGALSCAMGCATAAPAVATAPVTANAARSDDDVTVLKERVSRLERRLADVDAKLGLLLAQRTPPRTPSSITHGGAPNIGPRDLIVDEPKEEASLGARSIDFGTRRSPYEDPPEPVVRESEPDDSGPPVVIKITGDAPRDRAVESRGPRETVMADDSKLDLGTSSGIPISDQYGWAQARVKEGKYLEAINAFEEIVSRHPKHDLADNSVYWIGWCHQARGDHKLAVEVWQKLPIRYPRSAKVADALFGMAVSEEAIGEPAVAETLYEQLIAQYPKAEKVGDAKRALARLRPK